jgi:hypothetical protein
MSPLSATRPLSSVTLTAVAIGCVLGASACEEQASSTNFSQSVTVCIPSRPPAETLFPTPIAGRLTTQAVIQVSLSTDPPDAQLSLDGRTIANPSQVELPGDGARHELLAHKPGYLKVEVPLFATFDGSVVLQLSTAEEHRCGERRAAELKMREDRRQRERAVEKEHALETARSCLQKHPIPQAPVQGDELKLHWASVRDCYAHSGTVELFMQAKAAGKPFAFYGQSRRPVHTKYVCSDVCPRYGDLLPVMELAVEACEQAGAVPRYDSGWGLYQGCSPPELTSKHETEKAKRRRRAREEATSGTESTRRVE